MIYECGRCGAECQDLVAWNQHWLVAHGVKTSESFAWFFLMVKTILVFLGMVVAIALAER